MAFRVGITGTLNENAAEQTRERIRAVLETVKQCVEKEWDENPGTYRNESVTEGVNERASKPVLLYAISPLAEGADRIFAEEAIEPRYMLDAEGRRLVSLGYKLECPLPFRREEYAQDFKRHAGSREAFEKLLGRAKGAVLELDGIRADAGAYETVGRVVLDQCDLLIAVWDGQPAGGPGGTAHIMQIARNRVPMVCLRTDGRPDGLYLPGSNQPEEELTGDRLKDWLHRLLETPWKRVANPDDPDVTGSYANTTNLKPSFRGRLWRAFIRLMAAGCGAPAETPERIPAGPFEDYYRHYDALANRLVGLYRGSFLASYSLGVLAVFLALLAYAHPLHFAIRQFEIDVWAAGELIAIAMVFRIVFSVRNQRLHYRSVDCRYLAEQFRVLCYLYPLGLTAPPLQLPAHSQKQERKSWMEWRLRALLRQTPMPSGAVSEDYLAGRHREVVEDWIRGQALYHKRNHKRMHCVETRLDWCIGIFASLAATACVLHFFIHDKAITPWLTLCAAGLPAWAAACHAIATQGELRRLAERSEAMSHALSTIEKDLREEIKNSGLTLGVLRDKAQEAARLMVDEVADWQILYRKPVPLV